MQGLSFQRARGLGAGARLWVFVFGILAALIPPVLLVMLGVALHVLAGSPDTTPTDPILGGIVRSEWFDAWSEHRTALLAALAGAVSLLALLHAVCLTIMRRAAIGTARRAAAELKTQIHTQAFRLGCSDALGAARSWPEELFWDKTELVRQGLGAWWRAVPHALLLLAGLLALALTMHLWLTLLALVLATLIWRFDVWLREYSGHNARLWAERSQLADELLGETLNLAPLATNYSLNDLPSEPFADLLRQQQTAGYRRDVNEAWRSPWYWMVIQWGIVLLVFVIGVSPTATFSCSVVLLSALLGAYFPTRRLLRLQAAIPTCDRAARDIFAYLERSPGVSQMPDAKPMNALARELRLENVTLLDRAGHKILNEVSCVLPAGKRIAVLATDPQTPRAFAGLLVRFYDPIGGRILFDDVDIRWAELCAVRRHSALILSDALLFTGTVVENISCGQSEFTTDVIHDAAKQAHALDFIFELPDGLETIVGKHGVRIEDSMAFRVALARALIRNPQLLLIEEPQELNGQDGAVVDEALSNAAKGRTVIMLDGRLATLRAADEILLFHQGRLVGQGKHSELLQASELYRHINYIRFHPTPQVP